MTSYGGATARSGAGALRVGIDSGSARTSAMTRPKLDVARSDMPATSRKRASTRADRIVDGEDHHRVAPRASRPTCMLRC